MPCPPCEPQKILSHRPEAVSGFACIPCEEVMYEIRSKEVAPGAFVHRLLDHKEWKGRSEVQDTIGAEKNGLLQEGTWLESEIFSKEGALKQGSRIESRQTSPLPFHLFMFLMVAL